MVSQKDIIQMKACLFTNLIVTELLAIYNIDNWDDKPFSVQYMVVMAFLYAIIWKSMNPQRDKQRYIYVNITFLFLNIIQGLSTLVGDDSIWAPVLFFIEVIIGGGILISLYKKYWHKG